MKKKYLRWFSGLLAVILCLLPLFSTTVSAVSKIVLQDGSAVPSTILVGKTYALKVSDDTEVNFDSSNELVAKVGKTSGVLEPIAPGKVTITAKDTTKQTRWLQSSPSRCCSALRQWVLMQKRFICHKGIGIH